MGTLPLVRMSSGPALFPNASSTAPSAAAHRGVRSPSSRPAPPNVVASRTRRSSNPSPSPSAGASRRRSSSARAATSPRSAPPAAAPARISSASPRWRSGSRSLHRQISRAHDADTRPAAKASRTTGCAASRRIHPIAPAAAPSVTRVCHRSHVFADPW